MSIPDYYTSTSPFNSESLIIYWLSPIISISSFVSDQGASNNWSEPYIPSAQLCGQHWTKLRLIGNKVPNVRTAENEWVSFVFYRKVPLFQLNIKKALNFRKLSKEHYTNPKPFAGSLSLRHILCKLDNFSVQILRCISNSFTFKQQYPYHLLIGKEMSMEPITFLTTECYSLLIWMHCLSSSKSNNYEQRIWIQMVGEGNISFVWLLPLLLWLLYGILLKEKQATTGVVYNSIFERYTHGGRAAFFFAIISI